MEGQREVLIGCERMIGDERAKTFACEASKKQCEKANTERRVMDVLTGGAIGGAVVALLVALATIGK